MSGTEDKSQTASGKTFPLSSNVEEASGSCGTKCSVCNHLYRDPRILPCLHTLCLECVRGLKQFSIPRAQREDDRGPGVSVDHCGPEAVILCPVCDCEVDLPVAGVEALTSNQLILNEVLLERIQRADSGLVCDLCNDGDAERRCDMCCVNLCDFCSKAHRRQRKTASHVTVALRDLKCGKGRISKPVLCPFHPAEELRLFCETCDRLVCRDCCMVEHRDHRCDFIANVINKHGDFIRELLKQTQPHVRQLQETLRDIGRAKLQVRERTKVIAEEIKTFTEYYIKALEAHQGRLLKELEELKIHKENSLHLQQIQLEQMFSDVKTGVDFTEHLLTSGSHVEILLTKHVVVKRLKQLHQISYSTRPGEDDAIRFEPQERAAQCNGLEVFGVIVTKAVDPNKCVLQGEGLHVGRQDRLTAFTLVCNDQSGQQMGRGGESVRVSIFNKSSKDRVVKPTVEDNHDGTYCITYTPQEPGPHTVWVHVKGQHVEGSPFNLTVKSKFRKHTGAFHCCTFCSSGGQKDVRCGCGGTMLGGYQGCGHGHKGHPGRPHWSCCGKLSENSECAGPVNGSLYRSLVTTVAL
ncbi:tripartite motif-containing protein 45 [Callorhinchus milii]|uniref:RING-type E3 ubiquitin transferase n=1 Tax=Callorhinchus milii TaxID=7868 RepID=A0A4W3GFH6_CALMI|nr:tripartite motif-containing protein 45 [Callorhinchus milii]|eukprot:gi/632956623/ref/XP_007894049.1/ PREDICTED: tripartite motif-containing protein 45 [Callorhinchus milii]